MVSAALLFPVATAIHDFGSFSVVRSSFPSLEAYCRYLTNNGPIISLDESPL